MQLNDKDIRSIVEEVVKRYLSSSENSEIKDAPVNNTIRAEERVGNKLELIDEGQAQKGTRSDEVIIAVAPAFGIYQTETITHIPHAFKRNYGRYRRRRFSSKSYKSIKNI